MVLCIKSNVRLRFALIIVNKTFECPPIFKNEITYIVRQKLPKKLKMYIPDGSL
jgi:hypothetical protein